MTVEVMKMNLSVIHPGEALPGQRGPRIEMLQEGDAGTSWFAVQTRPRYEKKVERLLCERGITSFLPAVYGARRWSDRLKTVTTPMLPCYLFVRISTTGRARTTVLGVPLFMSVDRKLRRKPRWT